MSQDQIDLKVVAQELTDLHQMFGGRYRHVDEQSLDQAIEDAVLYHLRFPERFDASLGVPLLCYEAKWVKSYLYRSLRGESRHRRHEKASGVSEKDFEKNVSEMRVGRSIYLGREEKEQEAEEREAELDRERAILAAIVARFDPPDQAGVQLLLAGAPREEWVRHLGIEHLPRKEQQHWVNAEKDRLKKKLKRRAQNMQGGGSP